MERLTFTWGMAEGILYMGEEPRKEMSLLRRRVAWLSETAMTRKWKRHDGRGQDYGEEDGSEPQ